MPTVRVEQGKAGTDPWVVKVDSSSANPSGAATAANQSTLNTEVGIVTETAPADDTASSGLNGRLQRIAQRLTSLIAKLPAFGTSAAPSADLLSVSLQPAISGGWTPYRNIDVQAAGSSVKGTGGNLGGWFLYNNAATTRFLKVYDMAGAPASTDNANLKLTIPIPPGGAANLSVPSGVTFANGIGIRASQLVSDTDNTAPATNDVVADLWYK
jgi:hypothetical protein